MRELRLPALEKWLARADFERPGAAGMQPWLAERFALPAPAAVAAVSLAGEEGPREGAWLRADPVHLRVDGDSVVVHDSSVLGLRREEADALVAALQSLFAEDRLRFHAAAADRWYVEVPEGELPATVSLEEARGRNAFGLLPTGTGRINWRSAITEAQMLLSSHEVNLRREARGEPQVNGVWFWGEGRAPRSVERRYAAVHAASPFARGLARLSGTEPRLVPPAIADVDLVAEPEQALVVLEDLSEPLHRVDLEAWRAAAEGLEARWFRELDRAIDRFGTVRIVLPRARDSLVAVLRPAARRRWLRRAKPLAAHA